MVRLDRGFLLIVSERGVFRASSRASQGLRVLHGSRWRLGMLLHSNFARLWASSGGLRETDIARWKRRSSWSRLAANVDALIVVQALDGETIGRSRVRNRYISKVWCMCRGAH